MRVHTYYPDHISAVFDPLQETLGQAIDMVRAIADAHPTFSVFLTLPPALGCMRQVHAGMMHEEVMEPWRFAKRMHDDGGLARKQEES
jgi:nitroreductase